MKKNAVLSKDGVYRYGLIRRWGPGPLAVFVMLNPSSADAEVDDPTIRRCIGFAKKWGCDGIRVLNVFALRTAYPKVLVNHPDPVGPMNDGYIKGAINSERFGPVIAAWGGSYPKQHKARIDAVREVLRNNGAACLGKTKAGEPRHPLYLPAYTVLEPL